MPLASNKKISVRRILELRKRQYMHIALSSCIALPFLTCAARRHSRAADPKRTCCTRASSPELPRFASSLAPTAVGVGHINQRILSLAAVCAADACGIESSTAIQVYHIAAPFVICSSLASLVQSRLRERLVWRSFFNVVKGVAAEL